MRTFARQSDRKTVCQCNENPIINISSFNQSQNSTTVHWKYHLFVFCDWLKTCRVSKFPLQWLSGRLLYDRTNIHKLEILVYRIILQLILFIFGKIQTNIRCCLKNSKRNHSIVYCENALLWSVEYAHFPQSWCSYCWILTSDSPSKSSIILNILNT